MWWTWGAPPEPLSEANAAVSAGCWSLSVPGIPLQELSLATGSCFSQSPAPRMWAQGKQLQRTTSSRVTVGWAEAFMAKAEQLSFCLFLLPSHPLEDDSKSTPNKPPVRNHLIDYFLGSLTYDTWAKNIRKDGTQYRVRVLSPPICFFSPRIWSSLVKIAEGLWDSNCNPGNPGKDIKMYENDYNK